MQSLLKLDAIVFSLCGIYMCVVATGFDVNRDCNEPILQTERDNIIVSKFISTYRDNLYTKLADTTFSLPYPNSNTYAIFSSEINHQISINFSNFGEEASTQEIIILTGIKWNKLVGSIGHDQRQCEDPFNNQDTSISIFYKIGNTVKEIDFVSVEGEERTFNLYEKRRFMPLMVEWITIAIVRRDRAPEVCAQFELYGCRVRPDFKGSIEISEVVETIYPSPDNLETDNYTGECREGSCYGGVGLLTDGIKGTCNEWSRNGENIDSTLGLWFTLGSNEEVQKVILYGVSESGSSTLKYTVGLGLEGRGMTYQMKMSADSDGAYRIHLTTQEYFSARSVTSRYILINITTPDPGTFKLCNLEIHNQLGAITPKYCEIENNKLTCYNPKYLITYESSERSDEFDISEQSSGDNLNNGRDQLATQSVLVTSTIATTLSTLSMSNVALNNGMDLLATTNNTTSTSPIATSLSTPTVQNNYKNSTQDGKELFIYIGVGAAGLIIITAINCTILAVTFALCRARAIKIRDERIPGFPWATCVIYGGNIQELSNQPSQKTVGENTVVYVRTSEEMNHVPNMPVNTINEVEEGSVTQFRSALCPEGTVFGSNETHTYEEVVLCDTPSIHTEAVFN